MELNTEKYPFPQIYIRSGRECILDSVKHIFRPATPEEIVRQKIIEYLNKELDIPYQAIETEVPLCHFVKGAKGRMDIVIYGVINAERFPIMVVECKALDVLLTDDVYEQAKNYAEIVDIPVLMVTNGSIVDFLLWNYEKNVYEALTDPPIYSILLTPYQLKATAIPEYHYQRYHYEELFKPETIQKEIDLGDFIGSDCNKNYIPYIVNFAECLLDDTHLIDSLPLEKYSFIKDGGIRFTSFGNASGGSYPGLYRYILVKDKNNDVQIISIGVSGCLNRRSLLLVAIDDFEKHHNSLQLSLEHYSTIQNNSMSIFHDGTMTAGKRGSVKKLTVIDYMRLHSNLDISRNGYIQLGTLDQSHLLHCNHKDVKKLIANLTEYALLRDELRKLLGKRS